MADMTYSLGIDLAGNLATRARTYSTALNRFSTSGQRSLRALSTAAGGLDRGLSSLGNRYTALLTGAGATQAIRLVGQMDAAMRRLATDAEAPLEKVMALKEQFFAHANEFRIDPDQVVAGVAEIVAITGDLDFAAKNMRTIAMGIQATGALGADVGTNIASYYNNLNIRDAEAVARMFDTQNQQAKAGAVGFRVAGREIAELTGQYATLRRTGEEAGRELFALQQVVTEVTGNAPETTTAIIGMIEAVTDENKAAFFRGAGIRLREDDGVTYRALPEIMKDVIRVTGGDPAELSKVFDQTAKTALAGLAKSYDADANTFGKLESLLAIRGDGSGLLADARLNADGFNAAARNILTAAERFADEQLSGPVQHLADALNSLTTEQQNAVMWGGLALGGGSLAYVGGKRVLGAFGRGGAGAVGPVAEGLGEALGRAGPTPVVVTNWPPGFAAGRGRTGAMGRYGAGAVGAVGAAGVGTAGTAVTTAAGTAALGQRLRLRMLGRAGGATALGLGAVEAGMALAEGDTAGAVEAGTSAVGAGAGAWMGAKALGAAGGAMFGPPGAVGGGLIGAVGGALVGSEIGHEIGGAMADEVIEALERFFNGLEPFSLQPLDGAFVTPERRESRRRDFDREMDRGGVMPGTGSGW
ncbi:hypothetical protein [Roseospira navarrensis]|uniref:Tail tape measure protein n=1 Tax=Roseospira navarrensis TaxID=140058 RepID=A0A7X2D6A7_9PROT|nr:hypothetical protein [Roseospira navarrensis]MQX38542.1 hypothetical protein [Roseospira navarrensis]